MEFSNDFSGEFFTYDFLNETFFINLQIMTVFAAKSAITAQVLVPFCVDF